ncbi:M14 family metallopeptidase [Rhizobium binae]|uniref:M14 family metallopeptidase n=1 Tax=Rhizobium binae TaxID=1138190 RepID=UPI003DA866EF
MQLSASNDSCLIGQPGIFRGHLTFDNPKLAGYTWPICEIRGVEAGRRLCVSAGVHVNEVAGIQAAVRLQKLFEPSKMKGTVSIIPLINQPALFKYTEYVCPLDDKNINYTFPGRSDGSFSEALSYAIMNEWCADSDCYVDMHGGDLRERVSKFTIYQRTSNPQLDETSRQMAECFDAEFVMGLPTELMSEPGRPPTGFAKHNRVALMSEAGSNGLLEEDAISFHVDGVLNIARKLGILDTSISTFQNARILCDNYLWVKSPVSGEYHAEVEPGERIEKNQKLGTVRNFFGEQLAEITAPAAGFLLWHMTHPSIPEGSPILAVAVEAKSA